MKRMPVRPGFGPDCPRDRGFTIIELLIVVVVAGVLMAVALPSFFDNIRKSRRSEAFAAMSAVQQAQERLRSNQANYTTTLSDLGLTAATPGGYYDISLSAPTDPGFTLATGYTVTAVGVTGTSQAKDSQCRKLSARVLGGNVSYAGCGSCTTFTYTATHPCWAQ